MKQNIIKLPYGFFDRHLHLRRGEMTQLVLPYSAAQSWGGIIMPNTDPQIFRPSEATEYQKNISKLSPGFRAVMTCYLTDSTDPTMLSDGFKHEWHAVKLYPVGATTNSAQGVTSLEKVYPRLEVMENIGMPLLIHGEHVHEDIDPLDFERIFLEKKLVKEILERFPGLKVVLEHITTKESAELVGENKYNLWATVAPQYLLFSHKHLFQTGKVNDGSFKRGIRPRFWCMPIYKTDIHREALLSAVCSGSNRFGAGTDSAPHGNNAKYKDFGCGGCFNAKCALEMYAEGFDQGGGLDHLPNFLGYNMIEEVYGLSLPTENELRHCPTLIREEQKIEDFINNDGENPLIVENLMAGETLNWKAVLLKD